MKHIYKNLNFYGIMELICEFIRLILQSIKLIFQSTVPAGYGCASSSGRVVIMR